MQLKSRKTLDATTIASTLFAEREALITFQVNRVLEVSYQVASAHNTRVQRKTTTLIAIKDVSCITYPTFVLC